MSNEKFTKGPWFITEYEVIKSESSKTATGAISVAGVSIPMYRCEEAKANAALIAAAPEMYEMLQTACGMFSGTELASRAESLLAKARGE